MISHHQSIKLLGLSFIVIGSIFYLAMTVLPLLPARITDQIELPNAPNSPKVTVPDGRVFVANLSTYRVQRYGLGGFERGFWVGPDPGVLAIGLTPDGLILACTQRGHRLITYNQDGQQIGSSNTCPVNPPRNGLMPSNDASFSSHAQVPEISTAWLSAALFPLAYGTLYPWILIGLGIGFLMWNRSIIRKRDPVSRGA